MSSPLVKNVIGPDLAGYLDLTDELNDFLRAEYPAVPVEKFRVQVGSPLQISRTR